MVVNDRPSKRLKKRVNADFYDFLNFPSPGDFSPEDPFRISVLDFLSKHAKASFPASLFPSLLTWQILFRIGDHFSDSNDELALDVVEEDVCRSNRSIYCDQCRVVGWSGNPVCRKRYHFIIRANNGSVEGYSKTCAICGSSLHLLDSRCKSCDSVITAEDLEDWVYQQFEDTTHLLHGVVHSNGYGHLLIVNGKEGGSKCMSGFDIMNFWDRLCGTLCVRKVSVMDVSKKYGLDYRLLHAVAKGCSWYGNWSYNFGAGCYALTQGAYDKAVVALADTPLSTFFFQGRKPRTNLQSVIALYQSLSEHELTTLRDLFSFILEMLYDLNKPSPKKIESRPSNVLCAWSVNDVERIQQAMMTVLLTSSSESTWVTHRALKGTMCRASPSDLIDYSLKHLGGRVACNGMVVKARCNPFSNAIEFRLEPHSHMHFTGESTSHPSRGQIIRDLKFLYDAVLNPQTIKQFRPQSTRSLLVDSAAKLLDCKQFVKDYKPSKLAFANPFKIYIWCQLFLSDEQSSSRAWPPELIILPLNATYSDLKNEASKAFQEVYAMCKKLEVEGLLDYSLIDESITLKLLVGTNALVRIRGRASHGLSRFRRERGLESWTVDCTCGAKDDDGERMLACDSCGVWQHTRCSGINSSDAIPVKFVCTRCVIRCQGQTSDSDDEPKSVPSCREAAGMPGSCLSVAAFGVRNFYQIHSKSMWCIASA